MPLLDQPTAERTESTVHAETQNACFVCGQQNPNGLQIHYEQNAGGEVSACWTPKAKWEGFRDIVHGGIVSAVLDEAMSKAVIGLRCAALTAELRVRFRHHVRPGEPLVIRGWVVQRARRIIRTEATLTAVDGSERAHAWGSFLPLSKSGDPGARP